MSAAEIAFLIIIALVAIVAYLPRILLWYLKRKVRQHAEQKTSEEIHRTDSQTANKTAIADDEGEYVPFEEVKHE